MKYFDRYAKIVYSIEEKRSIMEKVASALLKKVAIYNISAAEIVKKLICMHMKNTKINLEKVGMLI